MGLSPLENPQVSPSPFLEVERLDYSYPGGKVALRDLTFSMAQGERVGMVGANGAGKSTLLLHLNGLIALSRSVRVEGLPVVKKNLTRIRQRVGLVFQNPDDQLFCTSLFEDIAFGLRNMGISKEEIPGRVAKALEQVGLPGQESRPALSMSVGEKKRAAMATVLAMSPALLCLDEPTAGLDPKGKRKLIALLKGLPLTQLVVTHDFDLVRSLCDRVLVLHRGSLAASGHPEQLLGDEPLLTRTDLW